MEKYNPNPYDTPKYDIGDKRSFAERAGAILVLVIVVWYLVVLPLTYIIGYFGLENKADRPIVLRRMFGRVRTWFWFATAIPLYVMIIRIIIEHWQSRYGY